MDLIVCIRRSVCQYDSAYTCVRFTYSHSLAYIAAYLHACMHAYCMHVGIRMRMIITPPTLAIWHMAMKELIQQNGLKGSLEILSM